MGGSPQIGFTRSKKGYEPLEVDAVLAEMQREIDDFRKMNRSLTDTIEQRDAVIRQLSDNTHNEQPNALLTDMFNKAARIAEEAELSAQTKAQEIEKNTKLRAAQIEREAQIKADEIIAKAQQEAEMVRSSAQRDAEAARLSLSRLNADIRTIIALHQKIHADVTARFSELSTFLDKAALDFRAAPGVSDFDQTVQAQTPISPDIPVSPAPDGISIPSASTNPYEGYAQKIASAVGQMPDTTTSEQSSALYEDFINTLKKEGKNPQYPSSIKSRDEIIGFFGEDIDVRS